MIDTLIIGSGYLGSFIKQELPNAQSTSLDHSGDIRFRLEDGNFEYLPKAKNLIITCSTEEMGGLAEKFANFAKNNFEKTILISTASLYSVPHPDAIIDEEQALKNHPRTLSESYFAEFASILHLGLLWDKELRQPHNWLKRIKNGNKYVNLCSSLLVAKVCKEILALDTKLSGHFICFDGKPMRWNEMKHESARTLPKLKTGLESKILCPKKLQFTLKGKIDWNSNVYL